LYAQAYYALATANAIEHGMPLIVVANGGLYSSKAPSTALCVGKKSPLHTPQTFCRKRFFRRRPV
jgi:hypothetical protein